MVIPYVSNYKSRVSLLCDNASASLADAKSTFELLQFLENMSHSGSITKLFLLSLDVKVDGPFAILSILWFKYGLSSITSGVVLTFYCDISSILIFALDYSCIDSSSSSSLIVSVAKKACY